MRTLALAIILVAAANAQPTYYARSVAGFPSTGDGGPARAARVFQPSHLAGDAAGNIYVTEALGRIRKIAADGTISTYASRQDGLASGDNGPAADAGISSLFGITVSGNFLYIAQRAPCNIRRISLTTGIITNFAGNFLYLAQRAPCNIRRINLTTGIITNFAGTGACAAGADGPALSTSLDSPGALAADSQGRIYVTEGARVRRIDPATGQVAAFAGDGVPGFTGDGSAALSARLNAPQGLAIDINGSVYISDTGNCRIRKVSASISYISTVAGSDNCGSTGDGGLALQALLNNNTELALDATGTQLYIASGEPTIRRLQLDTGIIDRYAGTGVPGPIQENVASLTVGLRAISGVFVDKDGNVLFSDLDANRVGKITANGNLTTLAGALMFAGDGAPAQFGFLSRPTDVITEPNGRLLISESINRRVRRVTPPGILSTVAGTGVPGLATGNGGSALNASVAPEALWRDGSGDIYLTDTLSRTVRVIGINGSISQVGPVFNSMPGGVAVDPGERFVYIAVTAENRIVRMSLSTLEVTTFAGLGKLGDPASAGYSGEGGPAVQAKLNSPQRLFMDPDGNLYVADSGNHRIRRISSSGDRIDTVAGDGTPATLPSPIGVAVDSDGNIIASNATAIFRVDKSTGQLSRIAGSSVRGTSPLGIPALQAVFHSINNVTVDSRGIIYFADQGNLRVIALTPSTLTTPTISGIIAPGAFGAGNLLTPGSWMEIYGDKLAAITRTWTTNDFAGPIAPTSLSGVGVRIGGLDAFVQSISPTQINAVVPDGTVTGNVSVQVVNVRGPNNTVISDAVAMLSADRAPYLLAPPAFVKGGKQYVAAVLPGGAFAGPSGLIPGTNVRPARTSDRLVVYGIGFGPTNPVTAAGNIATGITALPNVRIKVGGVDASVEYAGLASGFVGLYQFNFIVPTVLAGDVKLEILVDGQPLIQTLYLSLE